MAPMRWSSDFCVQVPPIIDHGDVHLQAHRLGLPGACDWLEGEGNLYAIDAPFIRLAWNDTKFSPGFWFFLYGNIP